MFLIGVSLGLGETTAFGPRAAVLAGPASIVITPLCLGSTSALMLYRQMAGAGVSFISNVRSHAVSQGPR
jgi:hypothetical protein